MIIRKTQKYVVRKQRDNGKTIRGITVMAINVKLIVTTVWVLFIPVFKNEKML